MRKWYELCGRRLSTVVFFDADSGGNTGGGEGAEAAEPAGGAEAGDGKGASGQAADSGGNEKADGSQNDDVGLLDMNAKEGEGEGEKKDGEAEASEGDGTAVTRESLKIPEGKEYDAELGDAFLGVMNDEKLSPGERAQKLLDMFSESQDKFFKSLSEGTAAEEKKIVESLRATERKWKEESLKDPEFGGEAFKGNIRHINAGRDKLATPGAVEVLKEMGLDNHPEIVRMFYRAGKLLSEDGASRSEKSANVGRSSSVEARADRMFGKSLEGLNIKGADDE